MGGEVPVRSQSRRGLEVLGQDQIDNLIGRDVYGTDGGKIGTAVQVYADDETGNPEWVTVQTGLFGTKVSFVPLADGKRVRRGDNRPVRQGVREERAKHRRGRQPLSG